MVAAFAACAHTVQEVDDSDPAVKARVEAALRGRSDLDMRFVTVDVEQGTVTISGLVSSQDQIRTIGNIIKRTHGVESVLNNLASQE